MWQADPLGLLSLLSPSFHEFFFAWVFRACRADRPIRRRAQREYNVHGDGSDCHRRVILRPGGNAPQTSTFTSTPRLIRSLATLVALSGGALAPLSAVIKPDYHLDIDPVTMPTGYYSAETPPVLKIKSGETVEIDTLALMGLSDDNPEKFFIDNNISL